MVEQYVIDVLSVGNKVRLRTKESLIAEYGYHRLGGISGPCYINREMEQLLGTIITISRVKNYGSHLCIFLIDDGECWCWQEYMFEISSTTELGNKFDN